MRAEVGAECCTSLLAKSRDPLGRARDAESETSNPKL